jgi:hypothetical protein
VKNVDALIEELEISNEGATNKKTLAVLKAMTGEIRKAQVKPAAPVTKKK